MVHFALLAVTNICNDIYFLKHHITMSYTKPHIMPRSRSVGINVNFPIEYATGSKHWKFDKVIFGKPFLNQDISLNTILKHLKFDEHI